MGRVKDNIEYLTFRSIAKKEGLKAVFDVIFEEETAWIALENKYPEYFPQYECRDYEEDED